MEIKQWRKLTCQSLSLLAALLVMCLLFSDELYMEKPQAVLADEFQNEYPEEPDITPSVEEALHKETREIDEWQGDYIKLDKIAGEMGGVYLTNDYMSKTIRLQIRHTQSKTVDKDAISRRYNGQIRQGEITGKDSGELFRSMKVTAGKEQKGSGYDVQIAFTLRSVTEPKLYDTADAYYVLLAKPREVFDKIIVLDAGHGGNDEGTFTQDGKSEEKAYTLAVVEELKKLFDGTNIKVYYTRLEDKMVSKKARVSLANDVQADLFISVHCNASNPGETSAHGVEALYSKHKTGVKIANKQLAEALLDGVVTETGRRKRGVIRREGLYLMHHSKVPTSIVEIGYMSNKSDMKYLSQKKGRQKIALGIYNGALRVLE